MIHLGALKYLYKQERDAKSTSSFILQNFLAMATNDLNKFPKHKVTTPRLMLTPSKVPSADSTISITPMVMFFARKATSAWGPLGFRREA